MPRHPEEVDPPVVCVGCKKDYGEDDSPLECDKVRSYSCIISLSLSLISFHSVMHLGISNVSTHLWTQFRTVNGSALTARMILAPLLVNGGPRRRRRRRRRVNPNGVPALLRTQMRWRLVERGRPHRRLKQQVRFRLCYKLVSRRV